MVLSLEIKTILLLAIKEALTNVLKHARATVVQISICQEKVGLVIKISDNGTGIGSYNKTKHLGIESITKRLENLSGRLEICQILPSGTELTISIPLENLISSHSI